MSGIDASFERAGAFASEHRRPLLAVLGVLVVVWPVFLESSFLFNLTLVYLYALLAFAAIVPIGYAGQLILSQGAFFGIGAYSYVELTAAGVPGVVAIPLAAVVTAAVAYVLGWPATRASGIYLGIITLSFNELFVIALDLFPEITGGSTGVATPPLFPESVTNAVPGEYLYYYLALAAFVAAYVVFRRVLASELGWAFRAIQEDRTVAESMGINTRRYRLLSFTMAGATCGLAGGLYAPFAGYLSPTVFNLHTSINIILAGIIGGLSVPAGGILGAPVVVLAPEFLRFISEYRLVVYGVLLILVLIYLPEGVGGWAKEKFSD